MRPLFSHKLFRRGQSTVEYVVLITVIVGVLIAMGTYFKRGVQGRWKSAVDDFGDQYHPTGTNSDIVYRLSSNTETRLRFVDAPGGSWTMRTDVGNTLETKTGYMSVGAN